MDDRTARLESAIGHLQLSVLSLQQRLDALEAKGFGGPRTEGDATARGAAEAAPGPQAVRAQVKDPYDPIAMLSLVGRLLLVLAGGFFLRAMTDAGVLAVPLGIGLAFAYAMLWLFMSDRAGGRGQEPNAVFHALAAALVAFPLAVEATIRFNLLTGLTGALVVSAATAGLLHVAWRRRLRALTWITVIGALPASAVLLVKTGVVVPFATYLIVLGLATLWLSYSIDWWGSRWPAALAADIAVAGVTLRAFMPEHRDPPEAALLLQAFLLVGFFGSIAIRTLVRGRDISRFEVVQSIAALLVSLGGALFIARGADAVPVALGVVTLLAGAACYGVAVGVVEKRGASALNLYFYTTLALVLVLAGSAIAIDGPWLGAIWGLLAVLATAGWSRTGRLFALLHGMVYIAAAGIASGAFGYGARALVAGAEGPWQAPHAVMLVVFVAGALSAALAAARPMSRGDELAIGTRFAITIATVWIAAGSAIGFIAPAAGGLADGSLDPGVLATVGTVVLSVVTLLVAWMGRHDRFSEWAWLVYPLLIGIGLKLVSQDFKHSRPATLFIALALYGAALIIAPRLRRRGGEKALAGPGT